MADDPLRGGGSIASASVAAPSPTSAGGSFSYTTHVLRAELDAARDPTGLLARWCVEGRARATLQLVQEGTTLHAAAHVLASTAVASGAALLRGLTDQSVVAERSALRACSLVRAGDRKAAAREFRALAESAGSEAWRRRSVLAAAHLAATEGEFRIARSLCERAVVDFPSSREVRLAGARIVAEQGDVGLARKWLEEAKQQLAQRGGHGRGHGGEDDDVSFELAEAFVLYASGAPEQVEAARVVWERLAAAEPVVSDDEFWIPPGSGETTSSFLATFVVSVVVGDVGEPVSRGSRWARHEAANNLAVCHLFRGELDKAVSVLEETLRAFGAPNVVDPIPSANLRSLYDLRRTPESERVV